MLAVSLVQQHVNTTLLRLLLPHLLPCLHHPAIGISLRMHQEPMRLCLARAEWNKLQPVACPTAFSSSDAASDAAPINVDDQLHTCVDDIIESYAADPLLLGDPYIRRVSY